MSFVTDACTFGATTQRACEAAGATLKNVLVDMFSSSPCETASVIAAEDVERGIIGTAAAFTQREDEALHHFLLGGHVAVGTL